MANPSARDRAIALLMDGWHRDLYEGTDGCFYVTYTGDVPGGSPCLGEDDIDVLLAQGLIQEKYPGCYKLRASPSTTAVRK